MAMNDLYDDPNRIQVPEGTPGAVWDRILGGWTLPNQYQPPPRSLTPLSGTPSPPTTVAPPTSTGTQGATGAKPPKVEKDFGTKDMMKLGLVLGALFAGSGGGGMGAGPNAALSALGGISEGLNQRHETQKRDMLLKQKQATDATNAWYEHAPNMDEDERETARQHINVIRQQAGMPEVPKWTQSAKDLQAISESQAQTAHWQAQTGQIGKAPMSPEPTTVDWFSAVAKAEADRTMSPEAGDALLKSKGISLPSGNTSPQATPIPSAPPMATPVNAPPPQPSMADILKVAQPPTAGGDYIPFNAPQGEVPPATAMSPVATKTAPISAQPSLTPSGLFQAAGPKPSIVTALIAKHGRDEQQLLYDQNRIQWFKSHPTELQKALDAFNADEVKLAEYGDYPPSLLTPDKVLGTTPIEQSDLRKSQLQAANLDMDLKAKQKEYPFLGAYYAARNAHLQAQTGAAGRSNRGRGGKGGQSEMEAWRVFRAQIDNVKANVKSLDILTKQADLMRLQIADTINNSEESRNQVAANLPSVEAKIEQVRSILSATPGAKVTPGGVTNITVAAPGGNPYVIPVPGKVARLKKDESKQYVRQQAAAIRKVAKNATKDQISNSIKATARARNWDLGAIKAEIP
jgi:hypothetical protein